jgi:hypothetical protein
MDKFTESYIEMVINNKQIQALCKYNKGDWFWDICEKRLFLYHDGIRGKMCEKFKWLPTLEDLFAIWCNLGEITNFAGLCQRITDRKSKIVRYSNIKYIKELCLEAIMYEFYNKSWNPTKREWEEINGS